jgi:hypothetical protein
LRDYYFQGARRAWNNEFTAWTTGTPWDVQFNEITYYIVPETYALLQTLRGSFRQAARRVALAEDFWSWSLVERRAWFVKEVIVNHLPQDILPDDLIAGGRLNLQTSLCLDEAEQKEFDRLVLGKKGARGRVKWFHAHGYGNAGATSGHLIPDHGRLLRTGWKGIWQDLTARIESLAPEERRTPQACQWRTMLTAADSRRLAFAAAGLKKKLGRIPAGTPVAIICLNMKMEDVLVRGRFGVRARYRGVPLATVDIDWVYNSMPPCHGQIYPELPLPPLTSFY